MLFRHIPAAPRVIKIGRPGLLDMSSEDVRHRMRRIVDEITSRFALAA